MTYEPAEAIALVVLIAAAIVPAWFVFQRRRDPFDPRVFFPIAYAYLTTGPCLFKIFVSGEYHPGLKVDRLVPVLFSCATAILGFTFGASIALSATRSSISSCIARRRALTPREHAANCRARWLAISCATLSVLAFGISSSNLLSGSSMSLGQGKADVIAGADEGTLRLYYFFAASTTAALTLAIIADAYASRSTFSLGIVALMAAECTVCTYSGERDFLLVGGVWCLANWRKLNRSQVLIFAAVLVGWLGVIPLLRDTGLGFGSQLAAVDQVKTEELLYSVTHFSPNVHVFTNVADEVPAAESHWHGKSLLAAVASVLPGDFEFKQMTPARWFRDIYDMQKVAGYAFAQDAEAYLNFGWIGPPIWFAVWGYLLGVAYRRAASPMAQIFDVFVWWYAVATSLFGIRSDMRGIFKMFFLGMVAAKLLCLCADAWNSFSEYRMRKPRYQNMRKSVNAKAFRGNLYSRTRPIAVRKSP